MSPSQRRGAEAPDDDRTRRMDDYVALARDAIARRDGDALATVVNTSSHPWRGGATCAARAAAVSLGGVTSAREHFKVDVETAIGAVRAARERGAAPSGACAEWDDVLGAFVACASCANDASVAEDGYESHARATREFVKCFKNDEYGAWMTPAIYRIVDDARMRADEADRALRARGEKAAKLADVGSTLMLVYRAVSQTSAPEKKASQLYVVNTLFRIYFKLNTLHLCKNLINAVNLPTFLPFEQFAKSEKVTYNFYVGRLAVFEDAYERADQHLTYAFEKCHAQATKNKRLILQYLIPVRLILGSLPTQKLLLAYDVREFSDIVEAMRRGDARLLNSALDDGEATFIKQGTYLILEKLRMSVYRTLFKKVHAIHGELEPAKANQLALSKFQIALKFCGADVDVDEVECIVANLIFRKFIKGYISHKNRVVVLSKIDPFPSLKTVFANGA